MFLSGLCPLACCFIVCILQFPNWVDFDSKDISAGASLDTEIGDGKVQGPPGEQAENEKPSKDCGTEVLASKSSLSDNLPSTSDPTAGVSGSLVPTSSDNIGEPYNKEDVEKEPCVDGSTVSVPVLSQSDVKRGTSEDSLGSAGPNINSALIDKVQGLQKGDEDAAAASVSMPLDVGVNKFDPACDTKDDETTVSTKSADLDAVPASDNLSKGATDNDPVTSSCELSDCKDNLIASDDTQSLVVSDSKTGKYQQLQNENIQLASAVEPVQLTGESGESVLPSGNKGDSFIDSSGSSNLNVSLVSVESSEQDNMSSVRGIVKSTEDELDQVPPTSGEHVDHPTITTSTISVAVVTTVEKVCPEPDSVPSGPVLPSEQGATMSSSAASVHTSTDPVAEASSDILDAGVLPMSDLQAAEADNADPSARHVLEGKPHALLRT